MGNVFHANFYNRKNVGGLERASITQKFGNHTLTLLDYNITSHRDYLLPPENTPVTVSYGQGPAFVRDMYGYVNHYETLGGDDGKAFTRMVVLGTSKVMNSVNPNTWNGSSRSGVARDVASRHRLRSIVHNHPEVVETWATGNRTDFQVLKALADETGYRLWVDGATVWLLDPAQVIRTASSMTSPFIGLRAQQKVRVFGGSDIPGDVVASKRRMQFGIDPRTNEFFHATSGDPTNPVELVSGTAKSFQEAQRLGDAAEKKQNDQFVLKAVINGNAAITPGVVVEVEAGRVNSDQAGVWMVNEAVHEVSRKGFTTSISASRGAERVTLARVPNTVRNVSGSAQAVVRNGTTWEAVLQEQVRV